jgi:hypothetical protein
MIQELIIIFDRDLDRLKKEIETFNVEQNLWITQGGISNSAGNLCMHLIGNLKTYIGKNIGNYPYIRERHAEFNTRHIPIKNLLNEIDQTKIIISSSLKHMDPKILNEPYIDNVLGFEMTNTFFLIHLTAHLSYHLGQINYLRRILDKE